MTDTVRALVFRGADGMVLEDRPAPRCGPSEVLLDVGSVGICGSDIHGYAGETGRRTVGMVMGHEVCGVVVEIGSEVRGWTPGDRACVNPVIGCRTCAACRAGLANRCPDRKVIGVAPDLVGAFTDRMAVPAANLVRFEPATPASPEVRGSLVEPLAVGLNAVRRAPVRPGDVVAVIGLGMIGLACVWAALCEGAEAVFAGDVDPTRAELVSGLDRDGRVIGLDLRTDPLDVQLRALGVGTVDVVVDAAGVNGTCSAALRAVRAGGVVSLVGMGSPQLELDAYALTVEEKSLVGSFCYSDQIFAECARAVASGRVDAALFVDRVIELAEAPVEFRDLASRARTSVKTIIVPQQ